jgi:hypothetical protein
MPNNQNKGLAHWIQHLDAICSWRSYGFRSYALAYAMVTFGTQSFVHREILSVVLNCCGEDLSEVEKSLNLSRHNTFTAP